MAQQTSHGDVGAAKPLIMPDQAMQAEGASIRPFEFHATDEQLDDLKRRIEAERAAPDCVVLLHSL